MNFFKSFFKILNTKYDCVFFSESQFYQKYYITLLNKLDQTDLKVCYLTSDKLDKPELKNTDIIFIGTGFFRMLILQIIQCNNFFLTLTDLGNHFIKSKRVKKYTYIFHAAVSTHKQYTENAFNNYDEIYCLGEFHKKELEYFETMKNLKKKKLVEVGYFYFDYLISKKKDFIDNKTVLIAPSWNYNNRNFLTEYFQDLVENIFEYTDYNIIFRPHPEHLKRNKDQINSIKSKYKLNNKFQIDLDKDNFNSCNKSSFLISDESGIIIEYLFVFNKPTLCFDKYRKIHSVVFSEIPFKAIEDEIKDKFAFSVNEPDFKNIKNYIDSSIKKYKENENEIDIFFKKNFYQDASTKALDYILKNQT